uniref:Protein ENL-like n=1 Tax=Nicotiana tabacum TaxID=4097 RepID=A0A1S4BFV0_TOBAC|nr:PREDICTED: uncharacterized protein LOC107807844 [Nicotiana tabacum]
MANPSEKPSSPPKELSPTPSTTPSNTPISKKGRSNMIARKTTDGSEQIKKINEKLKASQAEEPQKSEESFKSTTEEEEIVSSEIEQVISGFGASPRELPPVPPGNQPARVRAQGAGPEDRHV